MADVSNNIRLSKNYYNGEFDPGSGWTLAAGLIHASRTVSVVAILYESDVRVRNTYATYLVQEDSSGKLELTLHKIVVRHLTAIKTQVVQDGHASD
jgi:hypothetical protein